MRRIIWSITVLTGCFNLFAHSQPLTFQETFGGSYYNYGSSVLQTSDSNYIISGTTSSFGFGNSDFYLIKADTTGNLLWQKTYGGANIDYGYEFQQCTDGGFVMVGYSNSFGSNGYDIYLVRTNSNGDTLWTKTYGGTNWDFGYSVKQTIDSGFIITGTTYSYGQGSSDVYLMKIDSLGDTLWTKTFGGVNDDEGKFVSQTADSGFIITGFTNSFGADSNNVYLIKTNLNGDTLWTRNFGGANQEQGNCVQQTTDGGYIIAGYTNSFGAGQNDFYLIKTNGNGDTLWTITHGGIHNEEANSIKQTADGGYIITGSTGTDGWDTSGKTTDTYLLKTYSDGTWAKSRTFGKAGNDVGNSVQTTIDGGYIIAGSTTSFGFGLSNVYLIKTNDTLYASADSIIIVISINENPYSEKNKIQIFPNPFSNSTTVTIYDLRFTIYDFVIYDLLGRKVRKISTENSQFLIEKGDLENGMYLYKVISENKTIATGKLVIN